MKKLLLSWPYRLLLSAMRPAQKFAISFPAAWAILPAAICPRGCKGENAYRSEAFNVTTGFTIPKTGVNFAGEIVFYPWKNFGIGLGVEYQKYCQGKPDRFYRSAASMPPRPSSPKSGPCPSPSISIT